MGDRDRWAYYSEYVVQGIRVVGDRRMAPRNEVRVESPLPRLPPREQPRQRWYTPAQDFNEIRCASTDSSSYAGLGSDVDEDARVLQDLERRSKTWHDEEAARAREAKRRGWEKAEAAAERAAREQYDRRVDHRPIETRGPSGPIMRERGNEKIHAREPTTLRTRQWRSRVSESSGESDESRARSVKSKKANRIGSRSGRKTRASSASSSATDSDDDDDLRRRRRRRDDEAEDGIRAGKLIRSWGLKFNGSESRGAGEEFFEQVNDCRVAGHVSDRRFLTALSCAYKGEAARWFRMERERMHS